MDNNNLNNNTNDSKENYDISNKNFSDANLNSNNSQDNPNQKRNYNVRFSAVKILNRYDRSDAYIDKLLAHEFSKEHFNKFDKSLLTEIVNGVIRWRSKLDWILTGFYHGDFQKNLNWVKNAMRVGLYQILYLSKIPQPVAIYETVEITKNIQGEKTAGIVNGVLRNILRNIDNLRFPDPKQDLSYYLSVFYAYPKWLVKRWLEQFGPDETEKLLVAMNKRPYIPARINRLLSNGQDFRNFLDSQEVIYKNYSFHNDTLMIFNPKVNIFDSVSFTNGDVSIQDPSASLACILASPKPASRVADICAAPGGKSFYLATLMQNQGEIIAMDKYPSKLHFIEEGSHKLGIKIIKTMEADALTFSDNQGFDLVFADVPCSGLGTISKKPDIKWKRELDDIWKLANTQKNILDNAAKLVVPGGVLLYSTCTIDPAENVDVITDFLQKHPEFELDPAEKYLPEKVCKQGMMQIFPHRHSCDGAFAARLLRKF